VVIFGGIFKGKKRGRAKRRRGKQKEAGRD
jgi:hypothetical protein